MSNASGGSPTGRALIADLQRRSALLHRASNGFQVLALSEGGREMSAEQAAEVCRGRLAQREATPHKELEFGGGLWARYHEMKAQAMAEFVERVGTGRAAAAPVDLSGVNPYALLVVPEASSPVRPAPRPSAPPGAERAVPGAVGGVRDAGVAGAASGGRRGPDLRRGRAGGGRGGAGVDLEALAGELRARRTRSPPSATPSGGHRTWWRRATAGRSSSPTASPSSTARPAPPAPRNLPPARRRGAAAAEVLRQRLEQRRRTPHAEYGGGPRARYGQERAAAEAEFVERFAAPFPPDVRHADRGAVLVVPQEDHPPPRPARPPLSATQRALRAAGPAGLGAGFAARERVATGAGFTIEIPEG
eukprot:tig00000663_g3008.t1